MKLSWSFAILALVELVHIASVHGYPVVRHECSLELESRQIGGTPSIEVFSRYSPEYSEEIVARDWKALLTAAKKHYDTYKAGKKVTASPPSQHDNHAGHPHAGNEVGGQYGHEHAVQHPHSFQHPHTDFHASQPGSQHSYQHEYGGQHHDSGTPPVLHYSSGPPHDGGSYNPHSHSSWR